MSSEPTRPRIAVFKFASCDGCQLSLLDLEDDLLAIAGAVEIAYFPEASRRMLKGPYDIALVEGSITTHHDANLIQKVRRSARTLISIGACATSGGIQALRNFADSGEYVRMVYAKPDFISTLRMSTPIGEHVPVDFELRGCPIQKNHLVELITATLAGRKPAIPTSSVCLECKRRSNVCLMVAAGTPCLGPVTQAGCGALCPAYGRGCYGCFGPMESANAPSLAERFTILGAQPPEIERAFRTYNAWAWQFRKVSEEVRTS
ncbi:MAG: oxidoreductase [Acidobacteria bacterium]|nr:oxidoreductase [Acidobacteriota bacterium]